MYKTKIYEYCLMDKTIREYNNKKRKVGTYESRYFETDHNRSKGNVSR